MIRKGRFDEVFFVDLPRDDERFEIFRIHLAKRGTDPAPLGIERLVGITEGWTGAELEQCVVSAITRARLAGRDVAFEDLLYSAARIVPLSKTMKEKVDQLRNWARDRAAARVAARIGRRPYAKCGYPAPPWPKGRACPLSPNGRLPVARPTFVVRNACFVTGLWLYSIRSSAAKAASERRPRRRGLDGVSTRP